VRSGGCAGRDEHGAERTLQAMPTTKTQDAVF
jgi:hypothetical protein